MIDKNSLRHRFGLLHDGSGGSWKAVYLAFQVAARLGATLQVLLIQADSNEETLDHQIAEIETGARAAGIVLETQIVADGSLENLHLVASETDGFFAADHLVPDAHSALALLDDLGCPIWIISDEHGIKNPVLLVDEESDAGEFIRFTSALTQRLQEPLAVIAEKEILPPPQAGGKLLAWVILLELPREHIGSMLMKMGSNLMFVSRHRVSLIQDLSVNFVLLPAGIHA